MSRRQLVIASIGASAGLTLALGFRMVRRRTGRDPNEPVPSAWIHVAPDETVTLTLDRTEMGQGVMTALPMLLAEELEVPWEAIRVTPVVDDPSRWMREVGTAASRSVRGSYQLLRTAGAAAREMFVAAAAAAWGVEPSACEARDGQVYHRATGRRASYGSLAERAAALPVPRTLRLKEPGSFRVIGKSLHRLDTQSKIDGSARYGLDVTVAGMLVASIERAPTLGGRVRKVDASGALAQPRVRRVITLDSMGQRKAAPGTWRTYTEAGVAVLADDYWSAVQGRRALAVEWDEDSAALSLGSDLLRARFTHALSRPGVVVKAVGDSDRAGTSTARRIEAVYQVPLLHHATLEPMTCTASVRADGCDVWAPVQKQAEAQKVAAAVSGLPLQTVRIHTTFLGGGFGRRQENDFVAEAVQLSREAGRPVKVIWSREDDMRHGFYRPAVWHRLAAAIDDAGKPLAWTDRIAGLSIADWKFNQLRDGIDRWLVEVASDLPYDIPNLRVEQTIVDAGIPLGFFRSTGASYNCYATECFLDEIARLAARDPYQLRRSLLARSPRHRAVLDFAAERAGWGTPPAPGISRGIALLGYSGSVLAMVAEVALDWQGRPAVQRVVCGIDCGPAIHPDNIAAQVEGGVGFGLSEALYGEIEMDRGRVRQGNFDTYRILGLREMPRVETHILPSSYPVGGVGDPTPAPVIPAFCNAVLAATGVPVRRLPLFGSGPG